ncbi:hypothetical protein [Saccharothrix sp. ST-888]|uniref:hypothetical protein n=1 Tax=Saccharothrix sp. ST-888 TaxID=1427391 RepID=UPI0005EC72CE|nr:hypothetical protein [Saccharothrix sp. ST-888]KJK55350.1 hypothetical protein UK12_29190 [Saccharothrix sp. ST-888]
MPAAPTPWAGLPLPAEGDLPDVPSDVAKLANSIDNFLKLVLTSGATSSTPAPTTGQNLLNVNSQIAGLTSTLSTHTNQITALQAQIAALQRQPAAYAVRYTGPPIRLDISTTWPYVVQTLSIPPQSYRTMLFAYSVQSWGWYNDAISSPLVSRLQMRATGTTLLPSGSPDRDTTFISAADWTGKDFFMETLEPGVSYTLYQTIEINEAWEVAPGNVIWSDENSTTPLRIYAVTIPWTGAPFPKP